MANNPVEENFVTRYVLGFAVVVAMMIGGSAVGVALMNTGIPYGDWLRVAVGMTIVFTAFVVLYRRYDASYTTE